MPCALLLLLVGGVWRPTEFSGLSSPAPRFQGDDLGVPVIDPVELLGTMPITGMFSLPESGDGSTSLQRVQNYLRKRTGRHIMDEVHVDQG